MIRDRDAIATVTVQRHAMAVPQSQLFVVWMNGRVMLMVDGPTPPEVDSLVIDARASLVASGVHPDDIDVVWKDRTPTPA